MRAVLISAVLLGTAASYYGTAQLTSNTIAESETRINAERAKFAELETALNQQVTTLRTEGIESSKAQANAFEAKLNEQASLLSTARAKVDTLAETIATKQGELEMAMGHVSELETKVENGRLQRVELEKEIEQLTAAAASVATADVPGAVSVPGAESTQKLAELESEVKRLKDDNVVLEAQLEEAGAKASAIELDIAKLQEAVETRDAQIAELKTENLDTQELLAASDSSIQELEKSRDEAVAALAVATADATASAGETSAVEVDNTAQIQELTAALEESEAALAEGVVALQERDAVLAERDTALAERDAEISELKLALASPAPTTEAVAEAAPLNDTQLASLTEEVGRLTELTTVQAAVIQTLRLSFENQEMPVADLASLCLARAGDILEGSQIQFGVGTATIDSASEATLGQLRDLAIGCQNADLYIEIGGHTDSQGSEENNQLLSEARATSVMDFLANLGVPSGGMQAVGYGEINPIATNDTREGRTANRRITFEWKVSEAEAVTEANPATDAGTETPNG